MILPHNMLQMEKKTFRTKTGYCHILPDRIVLSPDQNTAIDPASGRRKMGKLIFVYTFLIVLSLNFAIDIFREGKVGIAPIFIIVPAYLVYALLASINNSAVPVIDRNAITNVKLGEGVRGLTRSRFEVFFKSTGGKVRKRLIMLPGTLSGSDYETAEAVRIMREENLLR